MRSHAVLRDLVRLLAVGVYHGHDKLTALVLFRVPAISVLHHLCLAVVVVILNWADSKC